MKRMNMFRMLASIGAIAAVAAPASAIVSNLSGNASVSGNSQGVFQNFSDVLTANINLQQQDAFANEALTVGALSVPTGSFTLSSHGCSGGRTGAVGSASASGNAGASPVYVLTSSTLPVGTPVQVRVNWAISGRVTAIGSGLMNVQDVAGGSLSAQVYLQVNNVTVFNRSGGYSRSVSLFDGTQVIRSGNINVQSDSDSQTVTVLVGQTISFNLQASESSGSFAFGTAVTDADVQCAMTWGISSLDPACEVTLTENPPLPSPPAPNGSLEHARELLPPRPNGTSPCVSFNSSPEPVTACSNMGQFTVSAVGVGTLHYVWELEVSPGVWVQLTETPAPLTCPPAGGSASVTPLDDPMVTITVRGCPGVHRVRCVVSDDCGQATSEPATFTRCLGDYNCDGTLNSQDFFDFLGAFFLGNADFNEDDTTNSQDYFDFLAAFFAGC